MEPTKDVDLLESKDVVLLELNINSVVMTMYLPEEYDDDMSDRGGLRRREGYKNRRILTK